jgi:hypothetical protein
MQIWAGFFTVIAGAAATLLGLLFVAVSINATAILNEADGNSRRLAEQAFQNYVAVLSVSVLAVFPSLTTSQFGFVTLAVTAVSGIWVLVRLYLAFTQPYERSTRLQSLRRQGISLIGLSMLIFAEVRMTLNRGDNRNLFAASTIILLIAATRGSWELLLTIAGTQQPRTVG